MSVKTTELIPALKKLGCEAIEGVTLSVKREDGVANADQALEWFDSLIHAGASGWAQFSGVNVWIENGDPAQALDGVLLAAELHLTNEQEGVSHHLRHDGDRWIATKVTRDTDPAAFLEIRSLLHKDNRTKLTYEVAWEPGADGDLQPVAFRFVGIE